MLKTIKKYWEEKPLLLILIAGFFFRLLSVIFSKGWGMHDDHFLVIETAQSWADGTDYNNWLPIKGNSQPPGHSYFYPGLHYLLFLFLKLTHINGIQTQMYIVRLIHAIYSISIIYFGFKITEKLSDRKNAALVGLLLAVYWFMPFLSVRNLSEMVCIPLLMYGVYLIINKNSQPTTYNFHFIITGLLFGLAFSVRYQTFIFIAGIFLVLLFQRKWKSILMVIIGLLLTIIIIEGGIDYFIWGHPFAEIKEYIHYNINNAYSYITQPWYTYMLFISGILIPPISIFIFIGFFKVWKKHLLIFLPTFMFLVFHSYFPNKQERFILTIIPFIIILGIIGWNELLNSKIKNQNSKIIRYSWIFFWFLNFIALPVVSTAYSKKARVESMIYLSKYQNIKYFVQEGTSNIPPRYYLGQWARYSNISDTTDLATFKKQIALNEPNKFPAFVLFYDDKNLNNRVNTIKNILPGLKYETTIEPGFIDKILYKLNPFNRNQTIYIYKNNNY